MATKATTLNNIKIPYPTEGIIRSAQLNDTITPENSVQLVVNMNFDRVGAIKTRLGIEQNTATNLPGSVLSLGSLQRTNGNGNLLFGQVGGNIYADFFATTGWTLARTLTNPANKARYATYLNELWMCNGNDGDPVLSTSSTGSNTLVIGQGFEGGKVAYILQVGDPGYIADGNQRGLIISPVDLSTSVYWHVTSGTATGATRVILGTGLSNTNQIIATYGAEVNAAQVARNYNGGTFTDWYLPSKDELNKIYLNKTAIGISISDYWSSTEDSATNAWTQSLNNGAQTSITKTTTLRVRAVRSFVLTPSTGLFGQNHVPAGFPKVDYLSAGFDGRVWGADKSTDTLYYTDIVQFTPPPNPTYVLTFDLNLNFIQNLSPQDGESISGLFRVPRALLVFKQNHIYRIYGANSIDAYPAYNVGTYSQESIIQAKDGIYFHHSSGFYKFDYNSQPTEISRRVIDFVKAISRSNYENILGSYDGFDNVEWAVGSVTVEGVTFSSCVMRYTISTQVWTIYDYAGNNITAMVRYDNGATINSIIGTSTGVVAKLDTGLTDLGEPIYYEMIDRWRCFNEMYSFSKAISGIMVSSENGAGCKLEYQTEKSPVDVWQYVDVVKDKYDALFPNASTDDFNNLRFRFSGYTRGTSMLFHAIEILSLQIKGLDQN